MLMSKLKDDFISPQFVGEPCIKRLRWETAIVDACRSDHTNPSNLRVNLEDIFVDKYHIVRCDSHGATDRLLLHVCCPLYNWAEYHRLYFPFPFVRPVFPPNVVQSDYHLYKVNHHLRNVVCTLERCTNHHHDAAPGKDRPVYAIRPLHCSAKKIRYKSAMSKVQEMR